MDEKNQICIRINGQDGSLSIIVTIKLDRLSRPAEIQEKSLMSLTSLHPKAWGGVAGMRGHDSEDSAGTYE